MRTTLVKVLTLCALILTSLSSADESKPPEAPKAFVDGVGPGWVELGEKDFRDINGEKDTWWWEGKMLRSTGVPIGVLSSTKQYKNFELVAQWRHNKPAGNSGFFVWVLDESLKDLPPGRLPGNGIEVQVLDHGYTDQYIKRTGKQPDWFSTNGDVFAVGKSKMKPFPPLSPNGRRSFPRKKLSKGHGQWNHYYIRAINGEVRLWVNGEEVSGGTGCDPNEGYLCLEAEGSPIDFKHIRIRELP